MTPRPLPAEPIVKPRNRGYEHRNIIGIGSGQIMVERTGELVPYSDRALASLIVSEPSSIIAGHNIGRFLVRLDRIFGDNPRWQFRLTPIMRERYRPTQDTTRDKPVISSRESVIGFFGFKKQGRIKSHYHYPLDPITFIGKTANEIRGKGDELQNIMAWAYDVRSFMSENDLAVKPTAGGIAAQLLRDKRFYPDARRKVPRATNARARDLLPGNYYELRLDPNVRVNAAYLDQAMAHHNCAGSIEFPHADRLFGKGFFRTLPDRAWARKGTSIYKRVLQEHGLLYVNLMVPHPGKKEWRPPYMKRGGFHRVFIYTNELPMIEAIGGYVEYVIAAWTSNQTDSGLPKYAQWARQVVQHSDSQRKAWIKPALLSTYGVLASRPRPLEFGWKHAEGGERKRYPVGGGMMDVEARATKRDLETPTVNVIQRGMIEAETRLRSIMLARELTATGMNVLAIYADSVFVQSDKPLPFLPEPWRIQQEVTDLRFFNSTSFASKELTKLPGIPREDLDRLRRLDHFRTLVAQTTTPKVRGTSEGVRQT